MQKKVTAIIDPNGGVKIENICGLGADCKALADLIVSAVGTAVAGSQADTPELHVSVKAEQQVSA